MQQAKAHAKMQRIAARKVRLVLDEIRGLSAVEAEGLLKNIDRRASLIVYKVLKSAQANAENNYNMNVDKLYIKETYATEGPTLKRMRPRAKGSASPINKRTSHITVVLEER
ncbi:MAG: 50S ribosomal protein L22 [Mycoplasmatales bacterium]